MKKLIKYLFKKRITAEASFHINGTDGQKLHSDFIKRINENDAEIIISWITYHSYSDSHKPAYINYVYKYYKK